MVVTYNGAPSMMIYIERAKLLVNSILKMYNDKEALALMKIKEEKRK
jgi:hypothetical protein